MEKCIFSNIHGFHDGGDGLGRDFFAWYRNEISHPVVRLFAFAVSAGFVLTDDNAQPYHVRAVSQYLQRRLVWPTLSPDINPTGHVWGHLMHQISQCSVPLKVHNRLNDLQA